MNIYNRPDLYDAIHKDYTWDNKLIKRIASNVGGPVLELASGTGRLTKVILDLGFDYTGIDSSEIFIKVSKKKFSKKAKFFLGDMQNFNLYKKFQFIFIGFNSFLHNLTDESAKECLKCVFKHLKKNGTFLISAFIPDPSFLFGLNNSFKPASSKFEFEGSQCQIMEKNKYNNLTQVNNITWRIKKNNKITSQEYNFKMRMFYPHIMDILLSDAGFKIDSKIGNYDGSPMDDESNMQIYICRKN